MSDPPTDTSTHAGDAFYRRQLDLANKEKALLQQRLSQLDSKHNLLLNSLFHLSSQTTHTTPPILPSLKRFSNPPHSGKGSAYRPTPPQTTHHPKPHLSFTHRADLLAHTSAVYAVHFSPTGTLLASVSFDRSLSFWTIDPFLDNTTYAPTQTIQDAHRAPVVAVEWTVDSRRVITASLDHTAAEWDVQSGQTDPLARYQCNALVNALAVSSTNQLFVATQHTTLLFDRRTPHLPNATINNGSSVNTIHVKPDAVRFLTADHHGAIKLWDTRKLAPNANQACIAVVYNDPTHRPITHVHTAPPPSPEEQSPLMAVNSYDAFLRVYDRSEMDFADRNASVLKPLHVLKGVCNANWPIKSTFYIGDQYRAPKQTKVSVRSARELNPAMQSQQLDYSSASDEGEHDDEEAEHEEDTDEIDESIEKSAVVASGSADGNVYVFDVSGRSGGRSQVLKGHKDRVYAAHFHPSQPMLASCSADASIKIWHAVR